METADLTFEEGADGSRLIILHGGSFGSAGAGPQRTRTEVYVFDGASYELRETTFDPTDVLYFRILEADALFATGNIDLAAGMYRDLVADEALVETGFHETERDELSAYALFRQALSILATDGNAGVALDVLAQARLDYPDAVNTGLALAFEDAPDVGVAVACQAVREHIAANADAFQAVWEYGYANPAFDAERVCPF